MHKVQQTTPWHLPRYKGFLIRSSGATECRALHTLCFALACPSLLDEPPTDCELQAALLLVPYAY